MTLTDRATAALAWLDAQLALCKAATKAPWRCGENLHIYDSKGGAIALTASRDYAVLQDQANARFIAAARTGYPEMLEGMKNSLLAFMEIEEHGFCHCEKAINFILTRIENLK